MLVRLTEANLHNDVAKLEEIAKLLGTVREGWAGIRDAARENEVVKVSGPENDVATHNHITVRV